MNAEWPLILFTFFLCLSGGIAGAQGVLTLLGKGKKMQMVSLVASLIALAIGGISVLFHLQHATRIFNGFAAVFSGNELGVSGITLELWGCVAMFIALLLYFLFMRRSENGIGPKWAAVILIIVGVALPVVTGDSYLMGAIPVWNTVLLLLYYLTNTVLMGCAASLVLFFVTKKYQDKKVFKALAKLGNCDAEDDAKEEGEIKQFLIKAVIVGAVAQFVVLIAYAIYIFCTGSSFSADIQYYFDPTLPDVHMVDRSGTVAKILAGAYSPLFYGAVILIGTVGPAILMWFMKKLEDIKKFLTYASISLVAIVIGGIVWRVLLYWVALHAFALY